ncbi:hypothetical protein ART_2772 [Arthrobacter sp. PAMC 25486]|nr:hypothetical protein ART_2772 [Arthrobacter sp. PAMC 25486]
MHQAPFKNLCTGVIHCGSFWVLRCFVTHNLYIPFPIYVLFALFPERHVSCRSRCRGT